jgi:hypothetical protein
MTWRSAGFDGMSGCCARPGNRRIAATCGTTAYEFINPRAHYYGVPIFSQLPRNYIVFALLFVGIAVFVSFLHFVLPLLGWTLSESGYKAALGFMLLVGTIVAFFACELPD